MTLGNNNNNTVNTSMNPTTKAYHNYMNNKYAKKPFHWNKIKNITKKNNKKNNIKKNTINEKNNSWYKPTDNVNWEKEIASLNLSKLFNPSKGGKRKSRTQRSKIEKRKTRRRR